MLTSALLALSQWVEMPHFEVAVAWPLALWSVVLLVEAIRGQYPPNLCKYWLAGVGLTFVTSRWEQTADSISLHLVCCFIFICLFLVYRRRAVPPLLAGSLVFFDLLMNDVALASLRVWSGQFDTVNFLAGVGGAGIKDGLVVFPLMTTAILFYANWRLGKTPRLALWY